MSIESDLRGPTPLRVRGPADLVHLVPFLLGFHPRASLVLVGLSAGQVVVTARLDLDDVAVRGLLADTVEAICRGGAAELVGIVFADGGVLSPDGALGPDGAPGVLAELAGLAEICARFGAEVTEMLFVAGTRWWSMTCTDPSCCPSSGRTLDEHASRMSAEATYAGLVALPDRSSVAALLEPCADSDRRTLEPLLEQAEQEALQRVFDARDAKENRVVTRALFAAARASDPPAPFTAPNEADTVRFGAALSAGYPIRDSLWLAIDDGRLDGRELWRNLAARLPGPYAAAPLFLFGWASWRDGNGAIAGMAAERALECDPAYTAADLLLAALSRGVDPRSMPRLRTGRAKGAARA